MRHEGRRHVEAAAVRKIQGEAATFDQGDPAGDAGKGRERPVLRDAGEADAPAEILRRRARRIDGEFAGHAAAVLPWLQRQGGKVDRKSTRLTPVTNAHLVCRLLLEKKKKHVQMMKEVCNDHN